LNNEKATSESFVDSWFKTGDIAEVTSDGYFKILGRNSSDIIKVRNNLIFIFLTICNSNISIRLQDTKFLL
jgi:acyl-CoA synthetase (AMP-forming)/AMP-acid ligase II